MKNKDKSNAESLSFGKVPFVCGPIFADIAASTHLYGETVVKSLDFPLFPRGSRSTENSSAIIAIMQALLEMEGSFDLLAERADYHLQKSAKSYPNRKYAKDFLTIEASHDGCGNNAAMRISPVAYVAKSETEVLKLAETVSVITHDSEGIIAAQAVALATYLALHINNRAEIKKEVSSFLKGVDFSDPGGYDQMYGNSIADAVPSTLQALSCFFSSEDLEDAVRKTISCNKYATAQAIIAASVASPFYRKLPSGLGEAVSYIPSKFIVTLKKFTHVYNVPHFF